MECSICNGNDFRGLFCRTCGNDRRNPAEPSAPGIASLISAYDVVDGHAAVPRFREALKDEDALPPAVRLVAWFEYAMSFTRRDDYLTLSKSLSTEELEEFIAALEKAEEVLTGLPTEIKQESVVREYDRLIPGNLNEARRILQRRYAARATSETRASSPSSGNVGCLLVGLVIIVLVCTFAIIC
jgi:hypothetical protein